MNRRRHLLSFGPELLVILALGVVAGSHSTAVPVSGRTVATANVPWGEAGQASGKEPKEYWDAFQKGFADAGKNCGKGFIYDKSNDWDRKGWVDGHNAGHAHLCGGAG
ncbi:hypothetical protein [Streptosporangium carneum]|uniref:Uncharacterized protein n=1 Tax=Streptosporangium carneum TaxID=47481 RepID=A0A9W6I853_9ACTN|nr:hypothetical protein [Streptosporangium carneum]GLK12983.1 hypothetical protein GCM10017600_63930 [Streptosporangium carneum]